MPKIVHSVELERELCLGCTNCIKRCPTEAIRVRGGKAVIINDRCIDCGECIRICPHKAKKARYDSFDELSKYKYNIALPAPSLYGQFDRLDDIDYVLNGLCKIGFDDVFEVSRAAEIISEYTRRYIEEHKDEHHPFISTACPVVVRLIAVRFPFLCDDLLPVLAPIELAAKMARENAKTAHPELTDDDIGVFFLSPCPAKVSYIKNPVGIAKSEVSGAISMSEIYFKLLPAMKKLTPQELKPLARSGIIGISWASTGGEASALLKERYLAADGIENVIKVLDEIENENFAGLSFIELNACAGGCVGGVGTVENPYIAKARLQNLRKYLPVSQNSAKSSDDIEKAVAWQEGVDYNPAMKLGSDRENAIELLGRLEKIASELPGLDCGACGAPNCHALAEDIVLGKATEDFCIVRVRENIQHLYEGMAGMRAPDINRDENENK